MRAALKVKEYPQENMTYGSGISTSYDISARRTALVMGGVGGIGSAICKKMADLGHFVAATYQNEEEARAWQDRMEQEGYLFFIYKYDTCSYEKSRALVQDVISDLGPIQILVNNADINGLDSVSHITNAAMEGMLTTGFGRIVNISAGKEKNKASGLAGFIGGKRSIHGITKALAREVASKGITVNTISPGYVATDMILSMAENTVAAQIPVGKLGRPEDVAHVVSFLVSEESSFINGANIAANGGYLV